MKKIIVYLTIITLIFISVLTLPLPKRLNISFDGIDTGSIENTKVNIEVKGTYLSYLLRRDKLKGHITISPYQLDNSESAEFDSWGGACPVLSLPRETGTINYIELVRYNEKQNRMTPATIFFDNDFERVLIEDRTEGTRQYISYSEKYDEADTAKFFETR